MITDIFHPNHPQNFIIQTFYEVAAELNDPIVGMDTGDMIFAVIFGLFIAFVIGFLILEAVLNVINKDRKK